MKIAKYFNFVLMLFIFLSLTAGSVNAKSLDDYYREGIQAYNAAQYQKTIEAWSNGLKIAEEQNHEQSIGAFLGNIGIVYWELGQYEKALEYYEQALAIRRKIKDVNGEGENLNRIGIVYRTLGQYEKALEYYEQALAISRKIKDVKSEGANLINIGIVYGNLGQYEKALEYSEQSLAISRKIKDVKLEGLAFTNIGNVYWDLGQYEKALEYYEQSLAISRKIKDVKGEGEILNNIGNVYRTLGQYEKALEYHDQALAISRKIKDVKGERYPLTSIGIVYRTFGQYEKALEYSEQALAISRKIKDVKGEGANLNNIGMVYWDLGQYEKALEYYEQALAIQRKIKDVKGEGENLNNIGVVYLNLGQYEKALEYYEQALAISRKIKDFKGEGMNLNNIGNVYKDLGQYEKALEYYEQALAIRRKIKDVNGEGMNLNNIGVVYLNLGQYEKALEYHEQALAIHRRSKAIKHEGLFLNNMGATLLYSGKLTKAEKNLTTSIQVYESIREKVYSGTERTGFQSTLPPVYGNLAATRIALGKPEKAFESIERGRAKSFLDLLGTREAGLKKEKIGPLSELENKLASLRENRVKLAAGPKGKKKRSAGASLDNKISELDKKRLDLIEQLRRKDPELGSLITVSPPGLKEIQSLLAPGTALVEYFHKGEYKISGKKHNQLWIFVIHKGGIHFTKVDVSKADLEQGLETYASLLAEETQDLKKLTAVNNQLYEWMIQPIEPIQKILTSHTLIFVPWGPMFKIPFAALAPKNGRPLATLNNIVMSPSAGIYRFISKKQATGRRKIFALGNPDTALTPLPGAEREVSKIGELFDTSIIKTRGNATETLMKNGYESLGRPDVIHFASHGIFNEKVPQLSHLALTPDQKNDGNLEMHEIFDLDWKGVSLVTMSACSSGKGKLGAGNDLVGLTRGFMFAGAPAVLCSLWDVDDEATKALMVDFYKNYIGGMSRPEALRRAQMSLMNTKKWSHPNYWSAFVLFGSWE